MFHMSMWMWVDYVLCVNSLFNQLEGLVDTHHLAQLVQSRQITSILPEVVTDDGKEYTEESCRISDDETFAVPSFR